MLDFAKLQTGQPITARDIRFLKQHTEENASRPLEGNSHNIREIPCVLNVDVLRYQFLQISHSSFFDDSTPWITASVSGGSNWVMFEEEYLAGQTGVCKVIPYDMPVMLRTGGSPQNGHRYNLPSLAEDENGEFTCVGTAKDAAVFWYVRNAGVGGGSAPVTEDYCTLITPVCNGFNDSIVWNADHTTPQGFNALRCGLGKLQSSGVGVPLQVFTVSGNQLVPKLDSGDPLFYKKLTIKNHADSTTPDYDTFGGIEFNELTATSSGWGGHAPFYAYLQSLSAGEVTVEDVQYDYSDLWETTTDTNEAIPNNYVVVRPHRFLGYYPNLQTFKVGNKESADISVDGRTSTTTAYALDYTLDESVRFEGQINFNIYGASIEDEEITWTLLATIEDYLNNYNAIKYIVPVYDGENLSVFDVNKIENLCGIGDTNISVPMGLYIDANGMPQFVNCESIPFQCQIPLLSVQCFYRINNTCSPAYQTNRFTVAIEGNKLTLLTTNYLPGSTCTN